MKKPTVLMILDGFGLRSESRGNAIKAAKKPNLDALMREYPAVEGQASGLFVGLPDGQMGNSEVGHMNMGAGRIVYQDLTRITKAIEEGDFFENPALLAAIYAAKARGTALHLMGLLSDGGVHSHNTHLYALLEMAKRCGMDNVVIHCFMDGRDTAPTSGKGFLEALQQKIDEIGVGYIGSVIGRYYVMDRDKRWERVEKAYRALTEGEGAVCGDAAAGIQASYDAGITDEFVEPMVIEHKGIVTPRIMDGDSVIFFNFRPDRAREISRALLDEGFDGFPRERLKDLTYVFFTDYDHTIPHHLVAFHKQSLANTFGSYISKQGLKQLRLAETEKYAHVTFFFNGGVEEPNPGEDRILVPSPKVATYDLQPEMSAPQVGEELVKAIKSGQYDVIIINFANSDMVGHTGVFEAAVKAVEAVDEQVGRAVEALKEAGGQMFLCADHGNSDEMIDYETGEPMTAHTTNPVPFVLVNADPAYGLKEGGRLCDIAPTLLELMGLEQPAEMAGESLLKRQFA
ncbi:MAG: 2,3-bisphosphoglycerate-independent phosphoglycerate mutase [Lachnospiraceae bacterium]|nr:2,3-bisphosphoglycerate-independent phosphoglycerate mutase [Lachnospiraceae bacterium]